MLPRLAPHRAPSPAQRTVARAATAACCALALALASGPTRAQGTPFALDEGGGLHRLWVVDDLTGVPAPVSGSVEFLPLDLDGVPRSQRLRADLPRRVSGAVEQVRLPAAGSLLRLKDGAQTRLVLLRTDGRLEVLVSVLDVGGEAGVRGHVAVGPDGREALVATSPAAGGDVLHVDLDTGLLRELTTGLPPLDVTPGSLRLGPRDAWFLAGDLVGRVDLADRLAMAELVTLPLAAGEDLAGEPVVSADGGTLAVVSEAPGGARQLYVVPEVGAPRLVTDAPGDIALPGLDEVAGPFVALSPDGERIAWRGTLLAQELFVRDTGALAAAEQVTADAQFVDTIDNVGILGFAGGDLLVFVAGEAGGQGMALGSADVFALDTALPGAEPVNLSQTSGEPAAPFTLTGELEIFDVLADPQGERLLLVTDPADGDFALEALPLDGSGPLETLAPDLVGPPVLEAVGTTVFVLAEPAPPSAVSHRALLLRPLGASPAVEELAAVSGTTGLVFDRFVADRAGQRLAFVVEAGPGVALPGVVNTATSSIGPALGQLFGVGPALAFGPDGRLSVGLCGVGGPLAHVGLLGGPPVLYGLPFAEGFPLAP